jgi:small GTP-binding protein
LDFLQRSIMAAERPTVKLVVIGDSGVGKTCLVDRIMRGEHESTSSTVAPAVECKVIKILDKNGAERDVQLHVWDTPGQDAYQSIAGQALRDAQIALVCYDNGRMGTIDKWVGKMLDQCPECLVILVRTKCDLGEPVEGFEFERAQEATKNFRGVCVTSAEKKTGIDELNFSILKCASEVYEESVKRAAGRLRPAEGKSDPCAKC